MKNLFKTLLVTLFVLTASTVSAQDQTNDELIKNALKKENPKLTFVKAEIKKSKDNSETFDVGAIDANSNPIKVYKAVVTINTIILEDFVEDYDNDSLSAAPLVSQVHYTKLTKTNKEVIFDEKPTEVNNKKLKEPKEPTVKKEQSNEELIDNALAKKGLERVGKANHNFLSGTKFTVKAMNRANRPYSVELEIETTTGIEYKEIGDTKKFEQITTSTKSVVINKIEELNSEIIASYSTTGKSAINVEVKNGEIIGITLVGGWTKPSKVTSVEDQTVSTPDPKNEGKFLTVKIAFVPETNYTQYTWKVIK